MGSKQGERQRQGIEQEQGHRALENGWCEDDSETDQNFGDGPVEQIDGVAAPSDPGEGVEYRILSRPLGMAAER